MRGSLLGGWVLLVVVAGCGATTRTKGDAAADGAAPDVSSVGEGGGGAGEAGMGGDVSVADVDTGAAADAATPADSDASFDAATPPPDVSADVRADMTDARTFGDAGLTCGHRSLSFEWRTPLAMSRWLVVHGAPTVDTAANELLLPPGGAVEDNALAADRYFLEFDLSIEGDMTFYVSPSATYANEPLPSITRSGSDLVLGTYAVGDTTTKPGGGFQCQHIPAQRVHVVLFLDPAPEMLGMEVIAGGQTFWSGFTVLSHPPQDLKLVGANLPATAGTARVHVGPISGCNVNFQNPCRMLEPGFCAVDGGSAPPF